MNALTFGLGPIEADFWRIVFLMTRIGAALVAAPIFGAMTVPPVVRTCVTGALAVFVSLQFPAIETPTALFSLSGTTAVGGEVVVGLALGFVLQLGFAAPLIAAELVGGGMGLGMASGAELGGEGHTNPIGQYLSVVMIVIFLAVDGHLHWFGLLVQSYASLPPGHAWLGPDRLKDILEFASTMFETAIQIALPLTVILLAVQLITGILGRAAPSLNLFALGLPLGTIAGLAALIMTAPLVVEQVEMLVGRTLVAVDAVITR